VVWIKARGASGSAAFGSFAKASNPVFRDLTERILVASKGRFDRAVHWKERQAAGLPWESTITKEDFLAWTVDTWEMRTESATRVGHPAPFPVELPAGSSSCSRTGVTSCSIRSWVPAAPRSPPSRADRSYVGYDAEPAYVALAQARIDGALAAAPSATPPA
jgi:site-specific DNA-methyltransferase (adenine-specific)